MGLKLRRRMFDWARERGRRGLPSPISAAAARAPKMALRLRGEQGQSRGRLCRSFGADGNLTLKTTLAVMKARGRADGEGGGGGNCVAAVICCVDSITSRSLHPLIVDRFSFYLASADLVRAQARQGQGK